jgi:small subunit ribosomal protein S21
MTSVGPSGAGILSPAQSHKTEGRVIHGPLSEVIVGDGESFEAALRRFNKKIQQAGILAEARRREFYERPAARRKRKEAKRRKR